MNFEHLLSPGAEAQVDVCRSGRELVTLVDRHSGRAMYATPAGIIEAASRRLRVSGEAAEIRRGGFVVGHRRRDRHTPQPAGGGLTWKQADAFVRTLHSAGLHRAFRRPWVAAQVVLGITGAFALAVVSTRDSIALRAGPADVPIILAIGLGAVFVHELGHALATVHYGRSVRSAGLGLHLGSPAFYVDSLDALLLTRRQRLVQAAAGPWAEWMVTSVALLLAATDVVGGHANELLHRFVIVNSIGIAINLLPFVGLDGSLLLADLVREPDLSTRSREVLSNRRRTTGYGRVLRTYAVANLVVGGLLVVSAAFFWWQLFGDLVGAVVSLGAIGWLVVCAAGVLAGRRTIGRVTETVRSVATELGPTFARLRFRWERRWRVRAMLALRSDPDLAVLDERDLGVLAGHLTTITPAAAAQLDDRTPCHRSRTRIAVLPVHWRTLVRPPALDAVANLASAPTAVRRLHTSEWAARS